MVKGESTSETIGNLCVGLKEGMLITGILINEKLSISNREEADLVVLLASDCTSSVGLATKPENIRY